MLKEKSIEMAGFQYDSRILTGILDFLAWEIRIVPAEEFSCHTIM
jgi:hypothetical protein